MKLQNLGIKTNTDKAQFGYLDIYENYLDKFLSNERLNLLEIGILGGSSLKMWREYFPKATILGADIESGGKNIRGETVDSAFFTTDSNSKFYLCDQSKKEQLETMCESILQDTGKKIDIFIDDGSHFQPDMMLTLGTIFPYMEKGGVFIIEDICTKENLLKGDKWWGSDLDENIENCVESTLLRYKETQAMSSAYLSEKASTYLEEHISSCDYYKAQTPPITPRGTSSLAVLIKK
jgi:hypothetical protein